MTAGIQQGAYLRGKKLKLIRQSVGMTYDWAERFAKKWRKEFNGQPYVVRRTGYQSRTKQGRKHVVRVYLIESKGN